MHLQDSSASVVLALVVSFGVGWLAGAAGRGAAEQQLAAAEERANFAQVRALIGDGRVSLFLVNFGDASRRFEEARGVVEKVQTKLRESGQAERAGRLEIACRTSRRPAAGGLARFLGAGRGAEALRALRGWTQCAPWPGRVAPGLGVRAVSAVWSRLEDRRGQFDRPLLAIARRIRLTATTISGLPFVSLTVMLSCSRPGRDRDQAPSLLRLPGRHRSRRACIRK